MTRLYAKRLSYIQSSLQQSSVAPAQLGKDQGQE